nr:9710_t:CDS:2 [Entrophospora candida]
MNNDIFLHCNACFAYSTSFSKNKEIRFSLTQCGRVICNSCVNRHGNDGNKQNGVGKGIKVEEGKSSSRLNANICLFCNENCAIVECNKDFQQSNTKSIINHLKYKVAQQETMLDKANNEKRELESQLINLANENVQLKNLLSMNENANQSSNRSDGNRTPKPNLGEHHLPVINHNDDIDVINESDDGGLVLRPRKKKPPQKSSRKSPPRKLPPRKSPPRKSPPSRPITKPVTMTENHQSNNYDPNYDYLSYFNTPRSSYPTPIQEQQKQQEQQPIEQNQQQNRQTNQQKINNKINHNK